MPGSLGAVWYAIKRHRERYAKITLEQKLEDDRYWAKQCKIDNIIFSSMIIVFLLVVVSIIIWFCFK